MEYKLTEYSHGAGCGCKLSPGALEEVLREATGFGAFPNLLVGPETKDDAAVIDLDGTTAIVSTTDFFMPIVDDPKDFGAIAATNAISDIYAMGAEPLMAIAILGWPIDKLPASVANLVLKGGREVCANAGIPLAGGHSIDAPEPIFGLAVTGKAHVSQIKRNRDGKAGDLLYLTKPLGVGVATTAQKKKLVDPADLQIARDSMLTLNRIGQELGKLDFVHALTDVTGFGLGGHLLEVCDASSLSARIYMDSIPVFPFVDKYIALNCIPGGTNRNWKTYGKRIKLENEAWHRIIADPQTSGGLLVAVDPGGQNSFEAFMAVNGMRLRPVGELTASKGEPVVEVVNG